MSLKARIEAVLFLSDKPVPAQAVAQLVNADIQQVRQAILELIHEYEERNSALEIADDGGYMMQVKDEFATIANDVAPIDLPVSIVRTLSAIAIKQPVLQSEIVRIRGAGAYDHIKELLEKELISKREEGRSALLSTTKKFQEYFRLSQDAKTLRNQLKEQSKQEDTEAPSDSAVTESDNVIGASQSPPTDVSSTVLTDADATVPTADDADAATNKGVDAATDNNPLDVSPNANHLTDTDASVAESDNLKAANTKTFVEERTDLQPVLDS